MSNQDNNSENESVPLHPIKNVTKMKQMLNYIFALSLQLVI